MAKSTIGPNVIAQQMQATLEKAGIDNATLDRLITQQSLDKVLADQPAVTQYFRLANQGYQALIGYPEFFKTARGEGPDIADFRECFTGNYSVDTSKGVPFVDKIDAKTLFSPEQLSKAAGFNAEEKHAYEMLLKYGMGLDPAEAQSAQQNWVPEEDMPNVGGGYRPVGKAMATGNTKALGGLPALPTVNGGNYTNGGYDAIRSQQDYIRNNLLQGVQGAGWFEAIFSRQISYRDVSTQALNQLEKIRQARQGILGDLQNIDMSTPEGMRQSYILQQKVSQCADDERTCMDNIRQAQTYYQQFNELVSSIMKEQMNALKNIAGNIK